ncbi:hypothetical protein PTKIN_Ptkin06aG0130900 [Pterospermum kingtungense]
MSQVSCGSSSTQSEVVLMVDCLTIKADKDVVNKALAFELSTQDSTMYLIADTKKEKEIGSTRLGGPSTNIHISVPISRSSFATVRASNFAHVFF